VRSGILDRILASKRDEVRALRARSAAGTHPDAGARPPRDAASALRRAPGAALRVLAEIKHRSPSAGPLSTALSVEARASAYARAGATMISVLCDGPFFGGGFDQLARARAALDAARLPALLLAKEFVVDEVQVVEARRAGADAVLLIARVTSPARLRELAQAARAEGLEPLVEVTLEGELDAALDAGARLVGVNARDLDTLVMDAARAARVLAAVPNGCVPIHLSGLRSAGDIAEVARGPAHAALVGEALMRLDDPAPLLEAMVAAASSPKPPGS
jgi:indole-3-glycerol phosphate synthase